MTTPKLPIWRLKAGADRRFRSGHPWVYSNELSESPKGIAPGDPIELCDAGGKFLARGYGNPGSLIAFRALTRDPEVKNPASLESLTKTLEAAAKLRATLALADVSHRLCFAEGDALPGLIIDHYRLVNGARVFVLQAHSAGADRMLPEVLAALRALNPEAGIVVKNDVSMRKFDGLQEEAPRVEQALPGLDFAKSEILVRSASGGKPLVFACDLVGGQKTGFFLDQAANIELAVQRLRGLRPEKGGTLRILDLCCYVGQWSAQLARAFQAEGVKLEITLADASATALALAQKNVEREGAKVTAVKTDVLQGLQEFENDTFDLVISDPPALIKGRKDIPPGTHAYLQLNTHALRLARRAIISCSCSSLLEEEDFLRALSKAAYRNKKHVKWVARGGQASDHPILAEFPEGRYLKSWVGLL